MKRTELEHIQDAAADSALRARKRIECAIDNGELPIWVMEVCTVIERASMLYGVTSTQLKFSTTAAIECYDRQVVLH